ncbi:apextrin-like protein 1 [Elysia marginata]|uniref:Apextrin-like protein 1 n=1 Tax=Elysia marginata TaxID=1093978 RepID=A0AAV4G7C8_9GAST|nr:apextrin-like protein 1 [Elysia marginata]
MVLRQLSLLAFLLVLHQGLALPVQDVSDSSMPFQLTVTPALVNRHTDKKMSLRCEHNPSVQTAITEISRIRIVKKSTSGWDLVAEQRDYKDSPTVTGNVTATSNIKGGIPDVFIQVTYNTIGPDCFGVFKCQVMGLDVKDEPVSEKSLTIEVSEFKQSVHDLISLSMDTQKKMLEVENFTDTEIARLNTGFQTLAKSVQTNHSAFDSRLDSLESRITQQEISMERKITGNVDSIRRIKSNQVSTEDQVARLVTLLESLMQWPSGHYALLEPKNGCPIDWRTFGGNQEYLKLHTQSQSSSDPADSHSSAFPSNTISTFGSDKFVTLRFCKVNGLASMPQGSFCVNKLSHQDCPTGFTFGSVHIDTEDTGDKSEDNSNVASGSDLNFCCQSSGSVATPIQLPTHSPFLLYRKGGACQAVQGMSVSEEYVQINTEDSLNTDTFHESLPDIDKPGSSVIKFNLCYYTKL